LLTFPHWKLLPLVVMAWSGAATTENKAMNFLRYCVVPLKLLTSETLLGTSHFMIASIMEGSIFIYPPLITYPKYTQYYYVNLHFLRFYNSWCFFNVSVGVSSMFLAPATNVLGQSPLW